MNRLGATLAAIFVSSYAHALSLQDITGRYEVRVDAVPSVVNIVDIKADGSVELIENSPFGALNCTGTAQIIGDRVKSSVSCPTKRGPITYEQEIKLQGVDLTQPTLHTELRSSLYEFDGKPNWLAATLTRITAP